jgi:hypothetical protein
MANRYFFFGQQKFPVGFDQAPKNRISDLLAEIIFWTSSGLLLGFGGPRDLHPFFYLRLLHLRICSAPLSPLLPRAPSSRLSIDAEARAPGHTCMHV